MEFLVKNVNELDKVAAFLKDLTSTHRIFAFYGAMGAGKTTLIKKLCLLLGTTDLTNSPTFSIINEYNTSAGRKIYHFDFYRLKELSEAYDIGYEEYFFSDSCCFIEWPEKVQELLPEGHVKVDITVTGENRIIDVTL